MKKIMMIFVAGVGLLNASSSIDRKLDDCRGDTTCMMKAVAQLVEDTANGGNNSNQNQFIEFYRDDGRCALDRLIKRVRFGISEEACQRAAATVTDSVWGVKIDGQCSDISDTNFLSACLRYAASTERNALRAAKRQALIDAPVEEK